MLNQKEKEMRDKTNRFEKYLLTTNLLFLLEIPSNATKCCSACFNRISRRLAPHLTGGNEVPEDSVDSLARQWTEEELEQLRRALREHGTNWMKVAEQVPGKTNHQCKNYYFAYRKKLSLDQVVAEYYQSLGEERRPCLTDEEESGSSTSSCDELAVSCSLRSNFSFKVYFVQWIK